MVCSPYLKTVSSKKNSLPLLGWRKWPSKKLLTRPGERERKSAGKENSYRKEKEIHTPSQRKNPSMRGKLAQLVLYGLGFWSELTP